MWFVLVALGLSVETQAAIRFYIVPQVGTGVPILDPFRPKYIASLGLPYAGMRYKAKSVYLVAADVTPLQHMALASNGDVTSIPQNLNAEIGANLATVQAALEALDIPSLWLNATHTYRHALAGAASYITIRQRFDTGGALLGGSITLNSTVGDLTLQQRNRLQAMADSFGMTTTGVTLQTTLRQVIRLLIQQLAPVQLMTESLVVPQ